MLLKMPNEFKGEYLKKGTYIKTAPRKWTTKEVEWCLKLKEEGCTNAQIAWSIDRDLVSVNIKMKRLKKVKGSYNENHYKEKYNINNIFLEEIKPSSILDLYCGEKNFYQGKCSYIISNDKNKNIKADYNMDALKLLCKMYYEGKKFDLVDLDNFGSSAECFDLSIRIAQKGLIITLGEMGHKRFKRLDYINKFYGINSLDNFTSDNLILHIQNIGHRYKKELVVFDKKDWQNISRVWFYIKAYKTTEQWE